MTKPSRRVAPPRPAGGGGKGPDASPTFATLHSQVSNPADVEQLLDALWSDLARVIAASRGRVAGGKGA